MPSWHLPVRVAGVDRIAPRAVGVGGANVDAEQPSCMQYASHQPAVPDMGAEVRRAARTLLVKHGPDGVTLRAIARTLGITAPALYRYYRSHSHLIEHLRADICTDLATELTSCIAAVDDPDGLAQFFAVLRGFRRWALAHPQEFTLVFASTRAEGGGDTSPRDEATEPFGRIVISTVWQVLATREIDAPDDESVPQELREDLAVFRDGLLELLGYTADPAPAQSRLTLGIAYLMVQYWTRIYGHVTLEVFGNVPMPTGDPDAWFDAVLRDIAREIGLSAGE